jgi:hypothetical protein
MYNNYHNQYLRTQWWDRQPIVVPNGNISTKKLVTKPSSLRGTPTVIRELYLMDCWPNCVGAKSLYEAPEDYERRRKNNDLLRRKTLARFNATDTYIAITAPGIEHMWQDMLKYLPPGSIVFDSGPTHNLNYVDPHRLRMYFLNFSKTGVPNAAF